MNSNIRKIREFFGSPKDIPIIEGTAIVKEAYQSGGESPSESFYDQLSIYNEDPVIAQTVREFAEQVISTGIFTSCNEKYKTKLPVEGKNRTAKQVIDEWNRKNNLDQKVLQVAEELRAFGNSFFYIGSNGFQNIPIEAILKSIPRGKDIPLQEQYDLFTTGSYGSKKISYGSFVHFKIYTSGHGPFGSGIVLGLMAVPSDIDSKDVPSLYDIRKSVRASMKTGFEKFSFGNEMWVFEDLPDDKIEVLGDQIAGMDSTGNRITTNKKGSIQLAVPQRTQSYDKWIEQIDKEFYLGVGGYKTPDTQFTTKATAEALSEAYKYAISAIRRVIKREIESLWSKALDELGFDSGEAAIRLNFGSEEQSLDVSTIKDLVAQGILTKNEARKNLMKIAKLELDSEEIKEEPKQPDAQVQDITKRLTQIEESVKKKNNDIEIEKLKVFKKLGEAIGD